VSRKLTTGQLADILLDNAKTTLSALQQHPSLKWTWGVDLDDNDILQLFRAAD